tara:strand:+ start:20807 stop:21271 length:465 start_codon:yes stop_codon:yes gene_type:complete
LSLNQILLIGNCGSDPEMRYTSNGSMVVNFSLAVNSYRNSPEGDQIQETEWFRVSCWNKTAESVNQFLQKGQKCFVEGRFKSSNYTANDGTQRQSSEVTAFRVIFLDRSTGNASDEVMTKENNSSQTTKPTEVKENIVETNQNDETDDVEELPW